MKNMEYEVRNPDIELLLKTLADRIRPGMPEGWGFTLMIFQYGQNGNLFYISTAQRRDMIASMRDFIKRFEEN